MLQSIINYDYLLVFYLLICIFCSSVKSDQILTVVWHDSVKQEKIDSNSSTITRCHSYVCVCLYIEVQTHPNWKLLNRGKCGRSSQFRIIGGEVASLGEYPWIARLGYSFDSGDGGSYTYQCGGAIISDRYILSAAHCSSEIVGYQLTNVRLGEHDDLANPDCLGSVCAPPVQDIRVEKYSCHPGFNTIVLHDDICLIRLAEPIKFNRYVTPICLPVYEYFRRDNLNHTMMDVAGWGVVDIYTLEVSNVLMKLKVPLRSNEECVEKYTGRVQISSKQLCAGGVVGKDSCVGDSGGPLMGVSAVGGRPRYFIVGIVSFGPRLCAQSDTPGVYTKVADYLPWILDNIRE